VLLVGEGALRFARARGFKEENLLTEEARVTWMKWKAKLSPDDDWLEPHEKRPELAPKPKKEKRETGTINFDCCNAKGEVSGVTTTSGLAFKIPGRVGDSPLIGAGLYVNGRVGAAGSTGRGEAVILSCGSHAVVEFMRQGMHPKDAALEGIRRAVEMSTMPYLLREDGKPDFQVNFYAVDTKGRIGGAAIWPTRFACGDAQGARHEDSAYLFKRD
ncbi:MAG: isoaspartyl peptidase/L-asparaginase, partial [Salinibacterium sp.]|nr:isoaspartyl peptidase/L-asparaginase [Salinibacterium sp.]